MNTAGLLAQEAAAGGHHCFIDGGPADPGAAGDPLLPAEGGPGDLQGQTLGRVDDVLDMTRCTSSLPFALITFVCIDS